MRDEGGATLAIAPARRITGTLLLPDRVATPGVDPRFERPGWAPLPHRRASDVGLDAPLEQSQVSDCRPRISVSCLGVFAVEMGNWRFDAWQGRKTRALFQYLVNHRDRPITREALVNALWPEPERVAAHTSLKVSVHTLRQTLAQMQPGEPALVVLGHESGYQLKTMDLWLDVEAFEQVCARARRLESKGQSAEALDWYAQAVQLYGGDFLSECWDDWAVFRREALKDQCLHALGRLAEASLSNREYQACIGYCQQLLEQDRCREDTYRMLMVCHAHLGQRGRVRRWYELCVRTLRGEIGVAPDPETERVYRDALCGEA